MPEASPPADLPHELPVKGVLVVQKYPPWNILSPDRDAVVTAQVLRKFLGHLSDIYSARGFGLIDELYSGQPEQLRHIKGLAQSRAVCIQPIVSGFDNVVSQHRELEAGLIRLLTSEGIVVSLISVKADTTAQVRLYLPSSQSDPEPTTIDLTLCMEVYTPESAGNVDPPSA